LVQIRFDQGWGGQISLSILERGGELGQFIANDFVAQLNAFITNEDRRSRNEFFDLMLTLAAKRAIEGFFSGIAFFLGHEVFLN
jgi:hypothetical protein